jgi:hypothetical protein
MLAQRSGQADPVARLLARHPEDAAWYEQVKREAAAVAGKDLNHYDHLKSLCVGDVDGAGKRLGRGGTVASQRALAWQPRVY